MTLTAVQQVRLDKTVARTKLIQKANRFLLAQARRRQRYAARLLTNKQFSQAVRVCRHNKLLEPWEYEAAKVRGDK